jgi:hypothetical protein
MASMTFRGQSMTLSLRFLPILIVITLQFLAGPLAKEVLAFPELVRRGYVNCTACHVSPTGSGVLTRYGRESSREVLSTWGKSENESQFAYGIVKLPESVDAIGMYRGVYAYQNTPFIQQGKYIFMQGDVEAAVRTGDWIFDAALGYQNRSTSTSVTDHLISRRHYVNYRPTDELSFRLGRFYPQFGILVPNHVVPTRRGLGWDEGQETYNLEGAWIGETWSLFLTGDFGRPDQPSLNRETGFAATPSVAIGNTYKLGLSYFYGNALTQTRNVVGIWGILGFTPHFFLLTEWDYQFQSNKSGVGGAVPGMVNYQRLDYELIQGLHVYLTQDYSRLNFHDLRTLANSYGVGIQFFPRPHFEFNLSWQKLRIQQISPEYTDFAWFLMNYYL